MSPIYAATGHRPGKLGGHGVHTDDRLRALAGYFFQANRPDAVISGMALGWDMAWAEAAIEAGIPVIAAVPFGGQELNWPPASQDRYWRILVQVKQVVIVSSGKYSAEKMHLRDRWMVDNSQGLIALWDGSPSGTGKTVQYAEKVGKAVLNLWPYWGAMQ